MRTRQLHAIFHSRLAISADDGLLLSAGWLWHPFVAGRRQLGEAGSGTGKGGKVMTAGGYTLGPRWGARLRRARPAVADGREASVADDRLSDGC